MCQLADGHEVEILTVTHGRGSAEFPGPPHVVRPKRAGWTAKAIFLRQTRTYARLNGFDVVHAHVSTLSPLSYASLRGNAPVPVVVTVHSLWRRYTPIWRFFDRTLGWSRWPIVWSAVSRAAADDVARGGVRPFDCAVVPNGIDLREWPLVHRDHNPKEFRIVSTMRLSGRKRPLPFLRMLRALRERLPSDVKLSVVIAGEGPRCRRMERYAARHGMTDWLQLPGQLPRAAVADALANADVYVAPATLESFGIAALEARATGLPVVGRTGSGLSEFIIHGHDGLLVDSDRAMVDALATLAAAPLDKNALDDLTRLQPMDWPNVAQRTMELYLAAGSEELVAEKSRQAS
jgi:glycosyltransferase involved in cell wall biosynthesis